MAGEDESRPHEKARHSLSGGGHEEAGLALAQQRRLRDPRDVGSRRGYGWGGAGRCGGGRKVPPEHRDVTPPQPQHLGGKRGGDPPQKRFGRRQKRPTFRQKLARGTLL